MKKHFWKILLLALALLALVALRARSDKNADTQPSDEEPQDTAVMAISGEAREIQLGKVVENTARGGIDLTVTQEDGTQTTYTFTDVAADAWYTRAINFAVSAGLMNGVADKDLFQPEYGISRELFTVIIYRLADGEATSPSANFNDVEEGKWYYDAVNWAVDKGLLAGKSDKEFGIGDFVTCEQALIVLYRLAGEPKTDATLEDYPYAPKVSSYGLDAVKWAWGSGLITEKECVWYPTQAISRAQVALLLMRYSAMEK